MAYVAPRSLEESGRMASKGIKCMWRAFLSFIRFRLVYLHYLNICILYFDEFHHQIYLFVHIEHLTYMNSNVQQVVGSNPARCNAA